MSYVIGMYDDEDGVFDEDGKAYPGFIIHDLATALSKAEDKSQGSLRPVYVYDEEGQPRYMVHKLEVFQFDPSRTKLMADYRQRHNK